MKSLILIMMCIAQLAVAQTRSIKIEAGKSSELSFKEFADFNVQLKNRTGKNIKVSVINTETNETVKGFGLGPMGKVEMEVPSGAILKLSNPHMIEANVDLKFVEKDQTDSSSKNIPTVSFTLHNSSFFPIPLIIPGVMNPNLSPLSNSGVGLKYGQEIYYKKGGKKKLLLVVDEQIQSGDKVDVPELIKKLEKDS